LRSAQTSNISIFQIFFCGFAEHFAHSAARAALWRARPRSAPDEVKGRI